MNELVPLLLFTAILDVIHLPMVDDDPYDIDYEALGLTLEQVHSLKDIFRQCDRIGNGYIVTSDLGHVAAALGQGLTPEEILEARQALDPEENGLLSFKVFVSWWA